MTVLRRFRDRLRSTPGVIDLASIMVGVLVVGILGGVITAATFVAVPWTQNEASKQDLIAVRTAEATARTLPPTSGAGKFVDYDTLVALDLIDPQPERPAVVASADLDGTCYIAAARSGSNDIFYSTSAGPDIHQNRNTQEDLDRTSWCASVRSLPQLVEDLGVPPEPAAPTFDAIELGDATVGHAYTGQVTATGYPHAMTYTMDGAPTWLTIDAATGALTGTPTATGSHSITFTVTNDAGSASETVAINVYLEPILTGGSGRAFLIDRDGNGRVWGVGGLGLTNAVTTTPGSPLPRVFRKISAGTDHTLALDAAGKLWAWATVPRTSSEPGRPPLSTPRSLSPQRGPTRTSSPALQCRSPSLPTIRSGPGVTTIGDRSLASALAREPRPTSQPRRCSTPAVRRS